MAQSLLQTALKLHGRDRSLKEWEALGWMMIAARLEAEEASTRGSPADGLRAAARFLTSEAKVWDELIATVELGSGDSQVS